MLGKNELEIVRILSDIMNFADTLSSVSPLFPANSRKLDAELVQARRLGLYRGLLTRLVSEIKSGVPLENIQIKKSRLWCE